MAQASRRHSGIDVQRKYSDKLRGEAISYLEKSDSARVCYFRERYASVFASIKDRQLRAVYPKTYQNFLKKQREKGVWGTYVEAIALAEKYNVTLTVTTINASGETGFICLHNTSSDKMVHLYNQSNCHWFFDGTTRGDGNCLYNAFSQALHHQGLLASDNIVERQLPNNLSSTEDAYTQHTEEDSASVSDSVESHLGSSRSVVESAEQTSDHHQYTPGFFSSNYCRSQAIALQFKKLRSYQPMNNKDDRVKNERERARIAKLNSEERKQIDNDYLIALQLAEEEMISSDHAVALKLAKEEGTLPTQIMQQVGNNVFNVLAQNNHTNSSQYPRGSESNCRASTGDFGSSDDERTSYQRVVRS